MEMHISKVREAKLELYRKKGNIHAKAVEGRFNHLRWGMVCLTQIVFYGVCWLSWETEGGVRQAVLFDIPHEKFHIFGLVLWPQDGLLLAFALIIGATALFLVTALAGRVFCGFACPQTVYTQIFTWVEAKVEGDHLARLKLDAGRMSIRKFLIKAVKHGIWALIAIWTAITFVGYFTPIRDLLPAIADFQLGSWEIFWLLFYAAFTYVQAGLAREAVCQHMCPYSRFQGVMFDPATRNVAYDHKRGEPRSPRRQASQAGDCIDCGICVQVCPVGIDIREGLQYPCINCGLCIDGCNQVMDKLGAPRGLIRFASEQELAGAQTPGPWFARPRIAVYAGLLLVLAGTGAWVLGQRSPLLVDVLRDRGALFRETPEGLIENAYTLKLMNLSEVSREFVIQVSGIPGARVVGEKSFGAESGSIRPVSLTVAAPVDTGLSGIRPMTFIVEAKDDPAIKVVEKTSFILP